MLIHLTRKARLRIRVPLWLEIDREPQLELQLPRPLPRVDVPPPAAGYRLRVFSASDESALVGLLRRAGFAFTVDELRQALLPCLPNGCFVIEHVSTGALVSTMMGRHLASLEHPFGGRIDWLATDPAHRGLGLGAVCARSATRRLMEAGFDDIRVTTDDARLGALKIFLAAGFQPVLAADTQDRWRRIHEQLNASRP